MTLGKRARSKVFVNVHVLLCVSAFHRSTKANENVLLWG